VRRVLALVLFAVAAFPAAAGAATSEHGDRIGPGADATLRLELAQRSMFRATALGAPRLADSWCGAETAADGAANAVAGATVKVVYAHPADVPDRFGQYADLIQADARGIAEAVIGASGGTRSVRFDVGTSCGANYLDIASITLPRTRGDYLALGLDARSDQLAADVAAAIGPEPRPRDHLVFADGLAPGDGTTGVAARPTDDRPGAVNGANAGGFSGFVFGDGSGGFGTSHQTTSLHEMLHLLGGVQDTAPHATGNGHCWQVTDVLCYDDGGPRAQPQLARCGSTEPQPFDCGADDYFSPSPAPGSYLATHWNIYNSVFLCPPASCTSGGARAPQAAFDLRDTAGNAIDHADAGTPVVLDGSASADPDGSIASWSWDVGADGTVDGSGPRITTTFPGPGAIPVRLRVTDASGAPDAVTRTVAVNPAAIASAAPAPAASAPASVSDGDSIDLEESSGSVLRRRLRQARTSSEKRLRRLGGVKAMLRGKVLAVHFRAPQSGDLTAMLRLKDLPVAIKTGHTQTGTVSAIHLRLKSGARRVVRRQRKPVLKLVLSFAPDPAAEPGRRPG